MKNKKIILLFILLLIFSFIYVKAENFQENINYKGEVTKLPVVGEGQYNENDIIKYQNKYYSLKSKSYGWLNLAIWYKMKKSDRWRATYYVGGIANTSYSDITYNFNYLFKNKSMQKNLYNALVGNIDINNNSMYCDDSSVVKNGLCATYSSAVRPDGSRSWYYTPKDDNALVKRSTVIKQGNVELLYGNSKITFRNNISSIGGGFINEIRNLSSPSFSLKFNIIAGFLGQTAITNLDTCTAPTKVGLISGNNCNVLPGLNTTKCTPANCSEKAVYVTNKITFLYWEETKVDLNNPDENPNNYICPLNVKYSISKDCNINTNSTINDPTFDCIFKSNDPKKSNYLEINNKYCPIYVREDIKMNMVDKTKGVAGQYFDYEDQKKDGNRIPSIISNKTYQTQKIDYNLFKSDYDRANIAVAVAYDDYVREKLQEEQQWDIYEISYSSGDCSEKSDCGSWSRQRMGFPKKTFKNYKNNLVNITRSSCTNSDSCSCRSRYCRMRNYNVSGKYYTYLRKVTELKNIVDTYTQCSTFDIQYDNKNTIDVNYDDQIYGQKIGNLKSIESKNYDSNWYQGSYKKSCNISTNGCQTGIDYMDLYNYECTGDSDGDRTCILKTGRYKVPRTTTTVKTITSTKSFINDKQFYSSLPNGIAYLDKSSLRNYVVLPKYIYPINLYEKNGIYNIFFVYNGLGDKGKFSSGGWSDNLDSTYSCNYDIKNLSVDCVGDDCCPSGKCPSGNSGFIYRTVNLSDLFPKRNPASNWNKEKEIVEQIQKNNEKIYYEKPDYSFTLNSFNIRKIRNYNKQQEINGKNGYLDFNLTCKKGTGTDCISEFLENSLKQEYVSRYQKEGISK